MHNSIAKATIHIHGFVVVFDLVKTNIDDSLELNIGGGINWNQADATSRGSQRVHRTVRDFASLMTKLEEQLTTLNSLDDATKIQFNDFIREARVYFSTRDARLDQAIALNKTPEQIQHAIDLVGSYLTLEDLKGRTNVAIGMIDQSVDARKFTTNNGSITAGLLMTDEMREAFEADGRFTLVRRDAWSDSGQMTSYPASWTISIKQ